MTGLLDKPQSPPEFQPAFALRTPVSVNLLPPEILAGRRTGRLRRRCVAALITAVLLLTGVGLAARNDTGNARASAAAAQLQLTRLTQQESGFAPLLKTRQQSTALGATLAGLLGSDLPWWKLLPAVQTAAPASVTVTSVVGTMTDPTAAAAKTAPLSDPSAIGTLTVAGTAPDKDAVAAFTEALGAIGGLTNPYVTSVTLAGGADYTFDIQLQLTPAALAGRFTPVTPR